MLIHCHLSVHKHKKQQWVQICLSTALHTEQCSGSGRLLLWWVLPSLARLIVVLQTLIGVVQMWPLVHPIVCFYYISLCDQSLIRKRTKLGSLSIVQLMACMWNKLSLLLSCPELRLTHAPRWPCFNQCRERLLNITAIEYILRKGKGSRTLRVFSLHDHAWGSQRSNPLDLD